MKRYIFKILVLVSVCYAMVMMLHWPIGFTFFTQLSNLFAAAAAGVQLVYEFRSRNERKDTPCPRRVYLLKYMSVVSVVVTFLVFLCVLAPVTPGGFLRAYTQDHCASLCMHLITPVLMTADLLINDTRFDWNTVSAGRGLIPPFVYLLFILLLGACGFRWRFAGARVEMMAPYAFLNYAAPAGWFGFRPETAGYTTLGVGVFYMILLLILVVYAVSRLVLFVLRKRQVRSDP